MIHFSNQKIRRRGFAVGALPQRKVARQRSSANGSIATRFRDLLDGFYQKIVKPDLQEGDSALVIAATAVKPNHGQVVFPLSPVTLGLAYKPIEGAEEGKPLDIEDLCVNAPAYNEADPDGAHLALRFLKFAMAALEIGDFGDPLQNAVPDLTIHLRPGVPFLYKANEGQFYTQGYLAGILFGIEDRKIAAMLEDEQPAFGAQLASLHEIARKDLLEIDLHRAVKALMSRSLERSKV